jgi:enamine deaminase RidA (YjgF/YER057c/UK114 family)
MNNIRYINSVPGYPAPHSPYSPAVVANGFVFVSGQIAVRPGGGSLETVGTLHGAARSRCARCSRVD